MKSSYAAMALLAACLSVPRPASCQDLAQRPPGDFRFGRVSVTPAIRLTGLGIDTNVFSTDSDRKADFTFTVTPQADALFDLTRLRILVAGGADYVYFQRYDTERSLNPRAGGTAELRVLRRSAVFVQESYADVRDRLNLEVDGRVRRIERAGSAGLLLGVTRNLRIDLAGSRARIDFDDEATFRGVRLQQTLDRETHAVDASVAYALTSLTTAVVIARASEDRFTFVPARDTRSTELKLGAEFKPRALLSGRASIGYLRSLAADDAVPDFSGAIAGAEIAYTLREATRIGFAMDRGKAYSYEPEFPFYRVTRYMGSVRRHLIGRADLTLEAELQKRAYEQLLSAVPRLLSPDADTVRRYATRLGVRAARRMRVGVDAEYYDQLRGRMVHGGYRGLRVGLTAAYGIFSVGDRVAPTR